MPDLQKHICLKDHIQGHADCQHRSVILKYGKFLTGNNITFLRGKKKGGSGWVALNPSHTWESPAAF